MNDMDFVTLDDLRQDSQVRDALQCIDRFEEIEPMICRSNNLTHSERLLMMHEDLLPVIKEVYGDDYREDYARAFLFLHDLHEYKTTDIPTPTKMKMSPGEVEIQERIEYNACKEIFQDFRLPITVNGYNTLDMMYQALFKDNLEAQVCSFIDKRDGQCDSINEIRLGNRAFMEPAKRYRGIMRVLPNSPLFGGLQKLRALYDSGIDHPFLDMSVYSAKDLEVLANEGKGTATADLSQPVGIKPYDRWTELHRVHGKMEYFDRKEVSPEVKVVGFND